MRHERPDPNKLRNSTIVVGMILLAFAFAQIELDVSKTITFLGFPLKITNPHFIGYTLIGLSLYFLFRFCFYSIRSQSTWSIRARLLKEFEPVGERFEINLASRDDVL